MIHECIPRSPFKIIRGHLIPPACVTPFVKRQKNDAADAEAICEAALRPAMRFVPVKSEETQGAAMVFRVRERLIRQRTQAINALRGHLGEFGQIVPQGAANAARLIAIVEQAAEIVRARPGRLNMSHPPQALVGAVMGGVDETRGSLFSDVDLEARISSRHRLRKIRQVVNDALASLDAAFEALYTDFGRRSIPPERLIRASPPAVSQQLV